MDVQPDSEQSVPENARQDVTDETWQGGRRRSPRKKHTRRKLRVPYLPLRSSPWMALAIKGLIKEYTALLQVLCGIRGKCLQSS